MILETLDRPAFRPRGGVEKVEVIPASRYAGGTASPSDPGAPASAGAVPWAFREDSASYMRQQTEEQPLVPLTRHTIRMEFAAGEEGYRAASQLSAVAAADGVVAILTLATGEVVTVGWSERFKNAYPLRMVKYETRSGQKPADFPSVTVTLQTIC
jgi:hypothetical protein